MGFSSEWSHCNADEDYCHCPEHNRRRSHASPIQVNVQMPPISQSTLDYVARLDRLRDERVMKLAQTNDSRCEHGWGICNICAERYADALNYLKYETCGHMVALGEHCEQCANDPMNGGPDIYSCEDMD